MKYKTLIFDFDGTIADTYLFLVEIYNNYCEEYNCDKIDINNLQDYMNKNAAQIIKKLKVPPLKIPAMITRAKVAFHDRMNEIKLFDGITEVIQELKNNGHAIGIVSSNTSENIHKFLNAHGVDIFDFIKTTNRVLSKHLTIKKILQEQSIAIENALYIGDEIRDIEAAKRIGMTVAAVTWGYNTKKALEAHQPDYLLDTPLELLKFCGIT